MENLTADMAQLKQIILEPRPRSMEAPPCSPVTSLSTTLVADNDPGVHFKPHYHLNMYSTTYQVKVRRVTLPFMDTSS